MFVVLMSPVQFTLLVFYHTLLQSHLLLGYTPAQRGTMPRSVSRGHRMK